MTKEEINQRMIETFFRNPKDVDDKDQELNRPRDFTEDEFDELMSDIQIEFNVVMPVKPSRYIYAPPGIDRKSFTIQQLSGYVQSLLNTPQQ